MRFDNKLRLMAKISIIEGKNKGEFFELTEDEIFIGRESNNQISLNDPSVSRRHCSLKKFDDQFFVNDLQSLNGTFVNEQSADNYLLRSGDRIQVGDFVFLFEDQKDQNSFVSDTVRFDKSRIDLTNSLRLSLEEVIGAMARDLSSLLKISAAINSLRSLQSLQNQLLMEILEVIPADTGAILLVDENLDPAETVAIRRSDENSEVTISQTIVGQVLRGKTAIMANDLNVEQALARTESLFRSHAESVLCAPLILFEKNIGALYFAASKHRNSFNESHLRFLTAVSGIAAVAIENVRNIEFLERETFRLREEMLFSKNMLGESEPMKKVFALISKVAPSDSTVLVTGETGTGKELAARSIHLNSKRREKPFVAINCAALSENLLESEIFGHERGAFTGAVAQKPGRIELSAGGTLFLDEIGEMSLPLQAKILRVLQEREFERVGGIRTIKADIRLIAATNRNLEDEVKEGNFRQDLFYRLNVVRLPMPGLRERKDDVLLLADRFVERFGQQLNRRIRGLSAKAKNLLLQYDYPGNVRELENIIERAVVLGESDWILPEDLPENLWERITTEKGESLNYHQSVQEKKRDLIIQAFQEARGSYTEAAKLLDVHPNYLHRLIRNLNIKHELES